MPSTFHERLAFILEHGTTFLPQINVDGAVEEDDYADTSILHSFTPPPKEVCDKISAWRVVENPSQEEEEAILTINAFVVKQQLIFISEQLERNQMDR